MTPETKLTVEDLVSILAVGSESNKTSSIVIVAEGFTEGGAFEVARQVKQLTSLYDTKVTVLGHIQRGGDPSCSDRVLASRLGVAAVEGLKSGQRDAMVGVVNDTIVFTPFNQAIAASKVSLDDEVRIARILSI
jgi:6-phosphofructokinase 1